MQTLESKHFVDFDNLSFPEKFFGFVKSIPFMVEFFYEEIQDLIEDYKISRKERENPSQNYLDGTLHYYHSP